MSAYFFTRTPAFGCKLLVNATTSTRSLPIAIALLDYKTSRSRKCIRLLHPTGIRKTKIVFNKDNNLSSKFFNQHPSNQPRTGNPNPRPEDVYRNPQSLPFLRPPSERYGSGNILLRERRPQLPKVSTWCRAGVPDRVLQQRLL